MKLIFILLLAIGCGKNETSKPNFGTYREEVAVRPEDRAETILEVRAILNDAVQRQFLHEFHNTKWYNQHGIYLCRSVVIDDRTYRLEYE